MALSNASLRTLAAIAVFVPAITAHADNKIINGHPVASTDLIAALTVYVTVANAECGGGDGTCSGTLIAPDTAITAAHCVGTGMKVRFGNKNNPQAKVATVTGYEHPADFNPSICESGEPAKDSSDIAVIHFNGGLPAGFRVAKIYDGQVALGNGDRMTLAGYGVTNAYSGAGGGTLRKTEVAVGDINYAATEIKLDSSHGTSDCFGDSGGPAFIMNGTEPLLYGSDSWGDADCRQFSIYTKVPAHMNWVNAATERLRAAARPSAPVRNPRPRRPRT